MACPRWALIEDGETVLTLSWSQCLQAVLDQENPDLYKWLTGQEVAPAEMQQNQAFKVSSELLLICCIRKALAGIDGTIHAAGTACERWCPTARDSARLRTHASRQRVGPGMG